jgi:hypothetical protein
MITLIVLVLIILLIVGAFPTWRYSANWGYGPVGVLVIVLIILVVLHLNGNLGSLRL